MANCPHRRVEGLNGMSAQFLAGMAFTLGWGNVGAGVHALRTGRVPRVLSRRKPRTHLRSYAWSQLVVGPSVMLLALSVEWGWWLTLLALPGMIAASALGFASIREPRSPTPSTVVQLHRR